MRLRDFLDQVRDLPPDTLLCVAEVDEAFAMNVASVEHLDTATTRHREADGTEAVNLTGGSDKVLVIRW